MNSSLYVLLAMASASLAFPYRNELYEVPWGSGLLQNVAYGDMDPRSLDKLGDGNLVRNLELALRANPELYNRQSRNLDSLSGVTFGGNKRFDPSFSALGYLKRNMDEIDHTGFNSFIRKRNFDEIDRTGFDGFVKKRNFDEIDRVGFGSFVKRDPGQAPGPEHQKN